MHRPRSGANSQSSQVGDVHAIDDSLLRLLLATSERNAAAEMIAGSDHEDLVVWTGTNADGTKAINRMCDDWAGVGLALTGDTYAFDGDWTASTDESCGDEYRLYCFEAE